jgi:hypothetical protein
LVSLVLAGDTPPPTLPKGFLENLPLMETLKDDEFKAFLQFVSEKLQPAPPTTGAGNSKTGDVTDDQ